MCGAKLESKIYGITTDCRKSGQKKYSCFRKLAARKCFRHIPALIVECVSRIYIFHFKKKTKKKNRKNTHTHTHKQKAKETKENRKAKETKEEKEQENVVVNNICGKPNWIQ